MSTAFSSFPLSEKILAAVEELGFTAMTPIQEQSLPPLLEGLDLIGQSKTGSGKTAAFTVPILQKIEMKGRYPQALILCPTRELATQVIREIRNWGRKFEGLLVVSVCGGTPARDQAMALRHGAHIVVGTPGRVLDLLDRGVLDLADVKTLVLDEADKMLEMGFEQEVESILQAVPTTRQTVLFSATFPEKIEALSKSYQKNPKRVTVADSGPDTSTIEQIAYEVEGDKRQMLLRVLQQHPAPAALIFCNQKVTVSEILESLTEMKVSCGALHGDMDQRERDRAMAMFRNGSYRILLATDVAARGLDIENLELVINYDFPRTPDTYIHRIGRTGRAGKTGVAVSLVEDSDTTKMFAITQETKRKFERPKLGFKNQFGLAPEFKYSKMRTLSISGGRKDKLRPGDILGALTGEAGGLAGSDVGKIEVQDHLTYVAVTAEAASRALSRLGAGKIKGQKFRVRLEEP